MQLIRKYKSVDLKGLSLSLLNSRQCVIFASSIWVRIKILGWSKILGFALKFRVGAILAWGVFGWERKF